MKESNKMKHNLTFKAGLIFVLLIVLVIPLFMVQNVVQERETRYLSVVNEIQESWSKAQVLAGPILAIPYERKNIDKDGRQISNQEFMYVLPKNLNINSNFQPLVRYRGLYEAVVYTGKVNISGSFSTPKEFNPDLQRGKIFLILGLSDVRGFVQAPTILWNNQAYAFKPGAQESPFSEGAHVVLSISESEWAQNKFQFSIDLELKGSNQFSLLPLGESFHASLEAPWPDPGFSGYFLPTDRKISAKGFSAKWDIPHLSRSYPQNFTSEQLRNENTNISHAISKSEFGVRFIKPLDNYKLSLRAVKYGLLFILFTFAVYFLFEANNRKDPFHILQYSLVGVALISFFIILLATGEYLSFKMAYLIASTAIILQISVYTYLSLKSFRKCLLLGAILTVLYVYLYITLLIEDYALLIGSISLFMGISLAMFFTRNVDWNPTILNTIESSRADDKAKKLKCPEPLKLDK